MEEKTNSNTSSSSSSSSSPVPTKKYDVFLSFRGEDTRLKFTGHLYAALCLKGIFYTFKDDIELDIGKDIGPELMSAIEDSHYAVVVLSESYATSSWCLRELAKIVECMGDSGRIRTIFYHVNPFHVRNVVSTDVEMQKESNFWKALEKHAQNPSHSECLEGWRNALVKVASQSGYPVEDHTDEAEFIHDFIEKLSIVLGASIRTLDEGLFGMSSRLRKLDSCILQSSGDVRFIGIVGMGGIGKSTLARAYQKRMSHEFEGSSFLQNVREICKRQETTGLVSLQKQLLLDILKGGFIEIGDVDSGKDLIKSRLRRKKVLVVVDDVDDLDQLKALADNDKWFGKGSIIIVTTRDESVLRKKYTKHRAEELDTNEALRLFSWAAFESIYPPEDFSELSSEAIAYASGLPLALEVLGSFLYDKEPDEWRSALDMIKNYPQKKIVKVLQISFDGLEVPFQHLFLHIACFFSGFDKDYVMQILDCCGFHSKIGIRALIDKSLLTIQHGNKLWMHDLLQDLGKEIVRKDFRNEPERQSRVWDVADFYRILDNKKGMINNVEAIVIFLEGTRRLSFEVFSNMKSLRLVMILGSYFTPKSENGQNLDYLSNELCLLQWNGFPYNVFPLSFQPRRLVKLKLCESNIEQLWSNRIEPIYSLKLIDLSNSAYFTKFEDFSVVPNLERLILEGCSKLSEIHDSIKDLGKLILLNLKFCSSLEQFPQELVGLDSLQILNLYGCSMLCKLPDSLEQLKSLKNLDVRRSGIRHLPYSIFLMENLKTLSASEEVAESTIKENIISNNHAHRIGKCFMLDIFSSLVKLDLSDCNLSGDPFPEYFGKLVWLQELDLSRNPLSSLPPNINGPPRLYSLSLEYCKNLKYLGPDQLPSSIGEIKVNNCTSLKSFLDPLKPCHLKCSTLICMECTELVKIQDGRMTALASLKRYIEYSPSYGKFEMILPGNELPAWFIEQSSTTSICMKLDPNCYKRELKGLAMALCFRTNSLTEYLSCDLRVCHENSESNEEARTIFLPSIKSRKSNHLFLCYRDCLALPSEWIQQLESSSSCTTLEFSFHTKHSAVYTKNTDDAFCGPCGVRLVYEEDIEILNKVINKYCINKESLDQEDEYSSHSNGIDGLSKLTNVDLEHTHKVEDLEFVERRDSKYTALTISSKTYLQDQPNPTTSFDAVIPANDERSLPPRSISSEPSNLNLECTHCVDDLELVERQDSKNTTLTKLPKLYLQDQPNQSTASDIVIPRHDEHSSPSKRVEESPIKKRVFKSKNDWARSRWPHSSINLIQALLLTYEHSSPSKRVEESPIQKRVFKSKNDWAQSRWPRLSYKQRHLSRGRTVPT